MEKPFSLPGVVRMGADRIWKVRRGQLAVSTLQRNIQGACPAVSTLQRGIQGVCRAGICTVEVRRARESAAGGGLQGQGDLQPIEA